MIGAFEKQANIDKGIERGIELGLEQGLKKGRAEGIAIGEKLAREKLIHNFMETLRNKNLFTIEQVADIEETLMKS